MKKDVCLTTAVIGTKGDIYLSIAPLYLTAQPLTYVCIFTEQVGLRVDI